MNSHFTIPAWEPVQMGSFSENELFRHFMFLGESGSGKTTSGIKPLCRLAFDSASPASNDLASALVVDPKGELVDFIKDLLPGEKELRLVKLRLKKQSVVLWQFENEEIEDKDGSSIVDSIFAFSESYQRQKEGSRDAFWIQSARGLLAALVDIDLALFRHGNRGIENIKDFWRNFYGIVDLFDRADAEMRKEESFVHIKSAIKKGQLPSDAVRSFLEKHDEVGKEHPFCYKRQNYLSHIYQLVSASSYYGEDGISALWGCGSLGYESFWEFLIQFLDSYRLDGERVISQHVASFFRQFTHMSEATYSSIQATFNSVIHDFVGKEFYNKISINPFEPPENHLSAADAINSGKIVVYEPEDSSSIAACVGKVLKRCFFKALLVPERLNNPQAKPFFYVCDEFQRFITHDPESGEQSFLDRCRAYRVCCVLATQSLASLLYVFPDIQGHHAINILVNNTGTKMFFRNTDPETASSLRSLLPEPGRSGRPHVIGVRPPSTLLTGECYYVLANGKAGRGQIVI